MKTLKLGFFCLALITTSTYAGGDHDHQHKQHDDTTRKTAHGDHASHGDHDHGEGTSPVGSPAKPSAAQSSILVSLTDQMRINFSEELTSIRSGEVIQFIVTNDGKIPHEFSIGNQAEQKAHAEMMRKMPDMVHADANTVTVEPGGTKTITWRFEGEDTIVFACNIPGHYEAGMFHNTSLMR